MIPNETTFEYEDENDELLWQIHFNKEQLSKLRGAVNALRFRMILLLFSTCVAGFLLIIGTTAHFYYNYSPIMRDYEVLVGAASIFGIFFVYESASSVMSIWMKWQQGRSLCREQQEAIDFAIHITNFGANGP